MATHMTDPEGGWLVAWCECGQCRYRWVAILEPGCPGDALECPECGELDGWLVKRIDPPTAVELRTWPAEDRDAYLRAASEHAAATGYPGEWF